MGEVPYEWVVEVEQELIEEGLPASEILEFCNIHTDVLKGRISHEGAKKVPPGHPVHTFREENRALQWEIDSLKKLFQELTERVETELAQNLVDQIKTRFYALTDVEKHYQRKEHLLFPYLEKYGITGPSKVMWAKDDEARDLLKAALDTLQDVNGSTAGDTQALVELVLQPATEALEDMIYREEQILFPMSLDTLADAEWYAVQQESPGVGFCLYDPQEDWAPEEEMKAEESAEEERIRLPTGTMTPTELDLILNTLPVDLTFVDKNDTVRYFTKGRERIFMRTRAILGRKVQFCHPPSSVHIVEQILQDFRAGRQSRAPFWINFKDKFIHIEYFALRDREDNYLGTLEVSQDLTEKRKLKDEQRLLHYVDETEPSQPSQSG
jgi:DUF438 domain-containing protein